MDLETQAYIESAAEVDRAMKDLATFISNAYMDARGSAGTLACIALDSSDRYTVLNAQSRLVYLAIELLNGED